MAYPTAALAAVLAAGTLAHPASAAAQAEDNATKATVATASPAAASPSIDPKAVDIIKASIAAYKALKAYSDDVSIMTDPAKPALVTGHAAFQRPAKFNYSITSGGLAANPNHYAAVSDGKWYWSVTPIDPKHYYKSKPDQNTAATAANDVGLYRFRVAPSMTGDPRVLVQMITPPADKRVQLTAVALEPSATVDGVPVDVVSSTSTVTLGDKVYTLKFTVSTGRKDHLVRRIVYDQAQTTPVDPKTSAIHMEEYHKNVKAPAALPASSFAFVPPAGLTAGDPVKLAEMKADAESYFDKRLVVGAKPFAFTADDLDGKPVDLAQYAGKVLVLDFWATWCGPCVAELPNVVAAYNKHHAEGLEVVGISLDNEKPALTDFIEKQHIPYRQVFDGKGWGSRVPGIYKVRAIPFMLVIGKDGNIAAVNVRGEALETAIKTALAAK